MNMRTILVLVKKDLKKSVREPAILFLLLLFPLMITLVFGMAFGGIGTSGTVSFDVALVNMDASSDNPTWGTNFASNLTGLNGMTVHYYDSNETAQVDLLNGNLDALIIVPEGFGDSCVSYWNAPLDSTQWSNVTVSLYVDSASMIAGSAIPPMVQQVLLTTLFGETAMSLDLPIEIGNPSMIETSTLTTWDYMAPGIFAFAVIFTITSVAQSMTMDRDGGVLERLATTPVTSGEYMISQILSNLIVVTGQVVVVFASAFAIGYRPATDLLGLVFAFAIVLAFSLSCVGLGLVTATISKSADIATGVAFIFIMPMMFFGTFMPLGGVSETIAAFMPSNYVTQALNTLFLRGAPVSTLSIWIDLAVVLIAGIAILAFGVILFEKRGKHLR